MKGFYRKELFAGGDTMTLQRGDNNVCEPHTHDFFEFVYVFKGEGQHVIDGKMYPVRKGSLLFINFGQTHSFDVDGNDYCNILLLPEYIGTGLARETEAVYDLFSLVLESGDGSQCVSFSGTEIEETENIVKMLFSEYQARLDGRKAAMSDLFHLLIIRALRKLRQTGGRQTADGMSGVLDWLKLHYAEKPTLAGVSERFFYNSSYFSRMFKKFTGEGFNAYVNSLKINEALELIESTALSMEEIAEKVGYKDTKTFYAQFKKLTGSTPGAFRKKQNKSNRKPAD